MCDEKFKTIVEKLSEVIKKYQFDDYDEPIKVLVKRLDEELCSKTLKSPYIKRKENITELWAFALQTKDLIEFDYSTNNDYYECSYYDGYQASFTVLQWEGDLALLDNIVNDWIADLEKGVSMEIHEFDAVKEKNRIIEWIRDWFNENGPNATAVIGISGGKDSTIVAALLVEALDKDRVFGVLMPNGEQKDIEDARKVIKVLGIKGAVIDISNAVQNLEESMEIAYHPFYRTGIDIPMYAGTIPSEDAKINIPARIRMTTLYAVAQSLPNGGRVANTCNASEDYVGYSTKYGDAAGDFAPIAGYTVTEVKAIGKTIKSLESVPKLIDKTPSDGLCGQTDEDKLGFTYDTLDKYIRTGVCDDIKIKETIDRMHNINLHKLKPIPCGPVI